MFVTEEELYCKIAAAKTGQCKTSEKIKSAFKETANKKKVSQGLKRRIKARYLTSD